MKSRLAARRAIGVNDAPADSVPIGSGPTRWAALAEVPRGVPSAPTPPRNIRARRKREAVVCALTTALRAHRGHLE